MKENIVHEEAFQIMMKGWSYSNVTYVTTMSLIKQPWASIIPNDEQLSSLSFYNNLKFTQKKNHDHEGKKHTFQEEKTQKPINVSNDTFKITKENLTHENTTHDGKKRRKKSQSNKINNLPPSKVLKFVPKNSELIQSPRVEKTLSLLSFYNNLKSTQKNRNLRKKQKSINVSNKNLGDKEKENSSDMAVNFDQMQHCNVCDLLCILR